MLPSDPHERARVLAELVARDMLSEADAARLAVPHACSDFEVTPGPAAP